MNNLKGYHLFLDDVRQPIDCITYKRDKRYTELNWVIVRSYPEFGRELLNRFIEGEFPETVSFDHDLSDEHYDLTMYQGVDQYNDVSKGFKEKTGKEAAEFLINFCIDHNLPLPKIMIHTQNPVGYQRIEQVIEDFYRFKRMIANEQSKRFRSSDNQIG